MAEVERRYLIFIMNGKRYAFDLAQVAEVCELPLLCPIPAAPGYYAGAMNFHGVIVAVMDLALFMGQAGSHVTEKLVVLDSRVASLAFLVERVVRIVPAGQVDLSEPPAENFAIALVRLADGDATLLDAAAIVALASESINN